MLPVLVGLGVAVFVLVLICVMVRNEAGFKERFPPITDAEFLARCRPGTNPEIALKVRRIVADALNVEYERIYPSSRFVGDLGAE